MIRELVLLSLVLIVVADWEIVSENPEKRSAQIFCGEVLAKTLHFICGGEYNAPYKKSNSYPLPTDYYAAEEERLKYRFPFSPKARALSVLAYRRVRRGVHDECCKKSCSINEIKTYCAKKD